MTLRIEIIINTIRGMKLKTLAIIVVTALVSSAGTFFYTTKQMAPSFYRDVIAKARIQLDKLSLRKPASDCSAGEGSLVDSENGEKPNMKVLLEKMRKARKEKNEYLKQFEKTGHQRNH